LTKSVLPQFLLAVFVKLKLSSILIQSRSVMPFSLQRKIDEVDRTTSVSVIYFSLEFSGSSRGLDFNSRRV